MTWITPLSALTFAWTTLAVFEPETVTPLDLAEIVSRSPALRVFTWKGLLSSWSDISTRGRTCIVRIATSLSLFSGFSRLSTVPAGSALNASSVGAKTVMFSVVASASASPAALAAASSVLNVPTESAVSTTLAAMAAVVPNEPTEIAEQRT